MKNSILLFLIITVGLFYNCKKTDKEILSNTVNTLNALEKVEYNVINHNFSKQMGMSRLDTALVYFDFSSTDTLIGAKYHFNSKYGEQVFDGEKEFSSDIDNKQIIYKNNLDKRAVSSYVFMSNSIYVIRKLLPELVKDSTIVFSREKDTILKNKESYHYKIAMTGKFIDIGAVLTESKANRDLEINYHLFIEKDSYLPVKFGFLSDDRENIYTASFSGYNFQASRPDSVFSYNRFSQDYLRFSDNEYFESMRNKTAATINKIAPNWELPELNGENVQLSDLKGSLVLLEFYFPNCGGCLIAIPHINEIQEKYASKGLKIYGIEFTKPDETGLEAYMKDKGIEIPTLYNGKEIAKQYGITAAPTFVLIDKKGKIVYAVAGLNKDTLIAAIEDNL
jgi:thiol-disulfide isomerase/thioredoxin